MRSLSLVKIMISHPPTSRGEAKKKKLPVVFASWETSLTNKVVLGLFVEFAGKAGSHLNRTTYDTIRCGGLGNPSSQISRNQLSHPANWRPR